MRFKRGLRRAAFFAGSATVFVATLAGCDSGKKHASEQSTAPSASVSTAPAGASSPGSATPAATSPTATPVATPSATSTTARTGAPHAVGTVSVPLDSTGLTLQTEAPDGTVFVGTPGGNVVWTAKLGAAPAVAEHVTGGADALAADAKYLYIASGHTVYAYSRSTGALARQWTLPASKDSVLNLELTGSRLWVRMGVQASDPPADAKATLVELNKSGGGPLRQETVPRTTDLVGGPTGLYYVLSSKTLVEQTDAGTTKSAPVNDPVNLELSGAYAIQAEAVAGNQLLVVHFAGQGLDATLHTYDASTLAGPSAATPYSAAATLAADDSGRLVTLENEGDCGDGRLCLAKMTLGTGISPNSIAVAPGALLGPQPVMVDATPVNGKINVTWFAS